MPANKHLIHIEIETDYIDEQSIPERDRYVFAYTVTIQNNGSEASQLLSRHWFITDANNNTQEVQGDGVIGQQPYLAPGEQFRYTSGTVLDTPVGSMEGSYHMRADDGTEYETSIPAFTLAKPNSLH